VNHQPGGARQTQIRWRRPTPTHPIQGAIRYAGRTLLYLTVGATVFAVVWAVVHPTFVTRERPTSAATKLQQLAAEHDCAPTRSAGHGMLLVTTPAGGPQLIPAPASGDEKDGQVAWLYDQHASWYGWCTP
jgi:hypothetical protein